MKKILISAGVVLVFVVYSLGIKHHLPTLNKPSALANSGTTASGSNTSSNNGPTAAQPVSYKDGSYNGSVADAYYGNVQVAAVISGGKLVDVKVLQSPNAAQNSIMINSQALPYLKQEAIQAQSAHVQIISGATLTSQAFIQSLESALSQA